jgi:type IV pilus assembly protein PilY1
LEPITATNSELSSDTLNWLYGANNAADRDGTPLTDQTALEKNNSDEGTRDVRASVHGDVIHSQPTIINYGKELADGTIVDDIVVYYGSNDGVFRAVQGGQSDTLSGHELWGFVHKSHFPDIETLRNNESGLVNIGDNRKPWFFDGDISSYFEDANKNGVIETGDKAYIYLTMRRGGNYVYGLDVSDYNNPKVLFDPISSSTAGFSEMAQSWSGVTITKIKGHTNPVMVFGAGYDASAQDAGPDSLSGSSSAGAVTKGRGIYVVDAVTGDKVVSIGPGTSSSTHVNVPGMTYDVPSKVAVLDVNGNGYADRFYVSDTGGNIWRVDTENDPAPADWTVTHFATASEDYDGDSSNDGRKLMYRVDVVSAKESDGTEYHAVLVGSGDREHPFDVSVQNYMMMFKDEYTGILSSQLSPITFSSLYNATANLIQDGSDKEAQIALLDSAKGWYIALREGEKVVSHVTSLAGVAYFNTNQPAPADPLACGTNLGIARIYQISVTNATAVRDNNAQGGITVDDRSYEVPGGGYPPPPVHIIVEIGGEFQEAVISGTEVNASPSNFNERSRNFWTKEFD